MIRFEFFEFEFDVFRLLFLISKFLYGKNEGIEDRSLVKLIN